jgi:WD40-like Beta Propeller Repeat/Peptidase MA superfamily
MRARVLAVVVAVAIALPAAAQFFGQNKVRYDTFNWKVYPTPHFRISFYDRVAPSLQRVASFAESAYDELARRLNFQIDHPIPMIIYATHTEFEQNNVIVDFIPEGVGAFAVPARDRMVLPVDVPDVELQHLIQHELTHVFQYEILFQGKLGKALATSPPQWFMEGMASYFGNDEDSRAKAVMRDAALSDRVPSVADDVEGYFAYRFGHRVFDFIAAEWGEEGVRDFVFEFRNTLGGQVDKAIKRAFDIDVEEFDARFRSWLRKQYLPIAASRGDPREFGPAFRVEEAGRSYETSPVPSPSGDLIAAFSTYKDDIDVVLLGVPDRKLFRNLTKGYTTAYDYMVAQLLSVGPDRSRDLAFSPNGDRIAVFARHQRGRRLLLLNALHGGIAKEYGVDVDQAMEPAYSPDGKTIAFRAIDKNKGDIFLLDLASGKVTNLTNDEPYDSGPVFTPDGTAIVYSSQSAEFTKLFRISLADPSKREQLTFGPGNDEGPWFSGDGKTLYFASDRDQQIYDIYGLNLQSHALVRLTHVIGAALNPVALPTRDGERVVYQAYTKGRWWLYVADPAQATPVGEQKLAAQPPEQKPYVPAVSVTIDPSKVTTPKKFKLFLDNVQVLAGIDQSQTFVSQTYLSFTDQYGDRRLGFLFESVAGYSNFQLSYTNLSRRLEWGLTAFDDRAYYVGVDTSLGFEQRLKRLYRVTGAAALGEYPLSRYYRLEGSFGYLNRDVDYPVQFSDGSIGFIGYKDSVPYVTAGIVGDTTFWREYGPHAGGRWSLDLDYGFDAKNGGSLSYGFTLDTRRYVPISARNEFAFRLWAAAANGNRPNVYYFGGLDTLRGFDYDSFAGNRAAYANIEWRFPLIDHLVLPWLHLTDIRGRFFLDIGAAWFNAPGIRESFRCLNNGAAQDCVSTYGWGFSANLLGLPMHWDFAKQWDFKKTRPGGFRTTFWIGYRY